MSSATLGTLLALGSAVSWALANVAIKPASERFGSWSALLWAQLFGVIAAIPVALAVEGMPVMDTALIAPVLLASVAASLAYGGLFAAFGHGQVSAVAPIIASWALISVVVDIVGSGRAPTMILGVGVVMMIGGNAVLAWSQGAGDGPRFGPAVRWACISAIGFGIQIPAVAHVGAALGRLWTVPVVWGLELVLLVPILAHLRLLGLRPRGSTEWWIISRAAVFEVGGFIAVSLALGFAPVVVVGPVSSLATACTVLLGVFLLRERLTPRMLMAALCASAGVVVINL